MSTHFALITDIYNLLTLLLAAEESFQQGFIYRWTPTCEGPKHIQKFKTPKKRKAKQIAREEHQTGFSINEPVERDSH